MPTSILTEMHATGRAFDQAGFEVSLVAGINPAASRKLQEFIRKLAAKRTLEIGMAMGCSTLAILEALPSEGRHTSVDPFQTATHAYGYRGVGVTMVNRAGLSGQHRLIEEPNYLALPGLLKAGEKFDLIFIDGWHTFDFAFIDSFYADLLLREGGILIFDDWGFPCVYQVTKFLEQHKAYKKLGPHTWNELNLLSKFNHLRKKVKQEREEWGSICAYEKLADSRVSPYFCASTFYPGFRVHRIWARLRGHEQMTSYTMPVNVGPENAVHSWELQR
ncbi:MAG: O-methyltransferase [Pyrinomonadaceae bacterium]